MKINKTSNDASLRMIAFKNPEWLFPSEIGTLIKYNSKWLLENKLEWMQENKPSWLANNYASLLANKDPEWMWQNGYEETLLEKNPKWLYENKWMWIHQEHRSKYWELMYQLVLYNKWNFI